MPQTANGGADFHGEQRPEPIPKRRQTDTKPIPGAPHQPAEGEGELAHKFSIPQQAVQATMVVWRGASIILGFVKTVR